jgi:hypothetical protein
MASLARIISSLIKIRFWVSISDSGCGIPEEVRSYIFDVFFTTKPAVECSLGTDIVKNISAKHQGQIELLS